MDLDQNDLDVDMSDSDVEPSESDDDVSSNRSVSMAPDTPTTFHDFSHLPAEIRLMIWELVLDEPKELWYYWIVIHACNLPMRSHPTRGLYMTSRFVFSVSFFSKDCSS